jgi:N-acetyl-gamma-glutamylphosphate reductase
VTHKIVSVRWRTQARLGDCSASYQTVAQEVFTQIYSFFVTQEFLSYMLGGAPRPVHCNATALSNQGCWPPVRLGIRLPAHPLIGRQQNQRVEVINTNPPAESM